MKPLHLDENGNPMPVFSPGDSTANATLKVDGTGASAQSTVISASDITTVRLYADGDCFISFGADPTAAATTMPMAGGLTEYFQVMPGHKIAVLGANLYITRHVS